MLLAGRFRGGLSRLLQRRPATSPEAATAMMNANVHSRSGDFYFHAQERVTKFLGRHEDEAEDSIQALTPDASTRAYFRVPWKGKTAIATVYPEPFDPDVHPFLDITRLFIDAELPAPEIYAAEGSSGIIVQEDLGDRQLYGVYESGTEEECEKFRDQAISIIAQIQEATETAFNRNCIASRIAFDEAKLSWELSFFLEHYFGSLRGETLTHGHAAEIKVEMNDIAAELAGRPKVLCHRDYHAANLMVDVSEKLRVIDYQDARMGPASYDLVSLLLDRQNTPPSLAEIRAHRLFFLEERRKRGLTALDPDDFAREFRLMTVQRCLKAVGTFSYQSAVCGRGAAYSQYIKPTLTIMLQASEWLNRFPMLQRTIRERIDDVIMLRSESQGA